MRSSLTRYAMLIGLPCKVNAWVSQSSSSIQRYGGSTLYASGQGFGKAPKKTYGSNEGVIKDVIDSQAAMENFFSTRQEWKPLFRSIASDASCQAMEFLETLEHDIIFSQPTTDTAAADDNEKASNVESSDTIAESANNNNSNTPWQQLQAIPDKEEDKQVLAGFLDEMHQSLINIPVTDSKADDENDLQFVEEGRRLLAINRFHVVRGSNTAIDSYDSLFATCWSELKQLQSSDKTQNGSIILVPDYELNDVRRFADINLLRPLEWLGVAQDFEVASLQRGSPAIRLLYKLGDIPADRYNEAGEPIDGSSEENNESKQ